MKGIHYKGIGNTKLTPIDFCGKTWGWMLETELGFLVEPKKTEPTKRIADSKIKYAQKLLTHF